MEKDEEVYEPTKITQYKPYGAASAVPMLALLNQYNFPDELIGDEKVFTIYSKEDNLDFAMVINWGMCAPIRWLEGFAADLAKTNNMEPPTGMRMVIVPDKQSQVVYELVYYDNTLGRKVRNGSFDTGAQHITALHEGDIIKIFTPEQK